MGEKVQRMLAAEDVARSQEEKARQAEQVRVPLPSSA